MDIIGDLWRGTDDLAVRAFLIRAVIIYVYIFVILKILGQRSISALNPLDFLFGIIIGDILGETLSDGTIGMAGPLSAAGFISLIHLSLSYIALKTPRFRRVIEDEPIILIKKGKILVNELKKTKVTVESLMMDLRLRDAADLNEVDYAVLESNGQISVIKKSNYEAVTPNTMKLPVQPPKGYPSVIILDGQVVSKNLKNTGGTLTWLQEQVRKKGFKKIEDVFLFTIDEGGEIFVSGK